MKTEEQETKQTQEAATDNQQDAETATVVADSAITDAPVEAEAIPEKEVHLAAEESLAGETAEAPLVETPTLAEEEVQLAAEESLADEATAKATPAEDTGIKALAEEEVQIVAEESLAGEAAAEAIPVEAEVLAEEEVQLVTEEAPTEEVAAGAEDEEEALPAAEEEIDDGRAWYVIHSYSGYENKVKRNLEHRIASMNMQDKIFRVVVPTEEEIEIKEGHRRKMKKRVFPGYILVQMIMDDDSWYVVRNTPGVTGFVSSGTKPTPLRPEEVEKIFKRMEREAPKIKVSFRVGQTVRIVDGPFADFVGTVDELNLDKGKVRVLVSFFGRETPVELDFLQVERQ